jgi:hypothetical protein
MAKPLSRYEIELDISNSDATKQAISEIERSINRISESAKSNNLAESLENAAKEAEDLAKRIQSIDRTTDGATAQLDAYGKAANRALADMERQAAKINYSLSEEGKKEREKLKTLQDELKTLGESRQERQRAREIQRQINTIQRNVLSGTDDELRRAYEQNRTIRARLRMSQQEARMTQAQQRSSKTLAQLARDDLKALRDKIKLQMQFIQTLRTTEGRYNAIKKAAGTVGKAGVKAAGIAGAGLLAISGVALSQSEQYVQREREASRIKAPLSKDEKQNLLSDLYMQSGADYTTIVDAINRVITVLGASAKPDDLLRATTAELRFPGSAAMFRQQNTAAKVQPTEFIQYSNRLKSIQSTTGASVEQITASTQKIANMRQSSFSNASMSELQALYLALQNSGAFDTDDELDRAFRSFVRTQKDSNKSVFELAREWQASGKWTRTAYGATNKTQALNTISKLDFGSIEKSAQEKSEEAGMTEAEQAAKKMREIEEAKNKILMRLVEAIAPVIESIDIDKLSDFVSWMIKEMAPTLKDEAENIMFIADKIRDLYNSIKNSGAGDVINPLSLIPGLGLLTLSKKASGGIAQMPSLCGEAGAEMVVPLDYSRSERGRQLTQNLNQYFNMAGNETTALSLAQAVKSRDFTNAMMNRLYINGRFGR